MNQIQNKFISLFKIDGIPILPPLMTPEKRKIMQEYKKEAIFIENNIRSRNKNKNAATYPFGKHDYFHFKNDHQYKSAIENYFETFHLNQKNIDKFNILKKSDTLIYDVISNTVIIPFDSENTDSKCDINPTVEINENILKNMTKKTDMTLNLENSMRKNSLSVPSITIAPPTPIGEEEKNIKYMNDKDISKTKRSLTNTSFEISGDDNAENNAITEKTTQLIRSNSFVIESPSKVLLEHMNKQQINADDKNLAQMEKVENDATAKIKVPKLVGRKKNLRSSNKRSDNMGQNMLITNTNLFKNKKSPYEFKMTAAKLKSTKKHKSPILKTSSNITLKNKICTNNSTQKVKKQLCSKLSNNDNGETALDDIKNLHKRKLMELMKKHEIEQKKMQEAFDQKQKLLLENLRSQINSVSLNYKECEQIKSSVGEKINKNKSAIRLLTENKEQFMPSINDNLHFFSGDKYDIAATTINKYIRGYLTRRLFNTIDVNRIVTTMRETLLFVIDLHVKTRSNYNPENIKLKARLFKQLTSSCFTLHKIFFEITTKDRMAIIAKDRAYKKSKLNFSN